MRKLILIKENNMKDKNKIYRLAQKINDYNEDEDGCIWGHILEFVEKAYMLGRETKEEEYTKQYS